MLYAPLQTDESDPTDSDLTDDGLGRRYYFNYIQLCYQLGLKTYSNNNLELRRIDAQVAFAAKYQGSSDDDIELTIWYGSDLARRLNDDERDIYAQSFTVEAVSDEDNVIDDEPPEVTTIFVDKDGYEIDAFETDSIHYGYPMGG